MTPLPPPGALMRGDIAEQPDIYARILESASGRLRALNAQIAAAGVRFVLITARGSSDHAALYAKYLVEIFMGLPVGLVSPSTYTVYRTRPDLSDVLFLAISQSGGSPDLIDSLIVARQGGAYTIAVTNNSESALAQAAHRNVDINAGSETSVAATKTYTAQLLTLYLLLSPHPANLAHLPQAAAASLADHDRILATAARYSQTQRIITTGRGFAYPTAREAALKLMETCYISAQAFSAADLLHGPLAMIDEDLPVIAILSPGPAGRALAPALDAIRRRRTHILTVGFDGELSVSAHGLPEEIRPMLDILPLQQLALQLALDRGVDSDRPRGLNKITQTW